MKECTRLSEGKSLLSVHPATPFNVSLEPHTAKCSSVRSEDAPTIRKVMKSRTPRFSVLFSHQAIAIE